MKVVVEGKEITHKITELLVTGIFENQHLDGALIELDKRLDGAISDVMHGKEFEGKIGQTSLIHTGKKISARRVLLVGLGKKDKLSLISLGRAAGQASKLARNMGLKEFSTTIYGATNSISLEDACRIITEWSIIGQYKYDDLKTEDDRRGKEIEYLTILVEKGKEFPVSEIVKDAAIESHAANYSRSIANTPANIATTEYMARNAKELAKELGIRCDVYDEDELKKMGMNALLGVGQGSEHPPKLIVLEYNPKGAKKTVAVLGKTIVFDSGGISIKPSERMREMKFDKCGGAMTLGIMRSVVERKIPIRVVGILAVAENMPGSAAQRPGDIVKSSSGKTIEIVNTDAEGRLVLCDAVHHAKSFKPDIIIDLATLTGAVLIALGKNAAGLFGNDEKMNGLMKRAGEMSTERVWELPAWDEYYDLLKSNAADIANHNENRLAGAIAGAMFIKKFVGDTPWIHLDIAGTSWDDEKPYMFDGATGFGVRLVNKFLELLEKEG